MRADDLYYLIAGTAVDWMKPVKTVDEDGFVRDIASASVDDETGCLVLWLQTQKKNGEIE